LHKRFASGLGTVRGKLGNGMEAEKTPCPHEIAKAVDFKGFSRQNLLDLTG
jgi:hypothetical protein